MNTEKWLMITFSQLLNFYFPQWFLILCPLFFKFAPGCSVIIYYFINLAAFFCFALPPSLTSLISHSHTNHMLTSRLFIVMRHMETVRLDTTAAYRELYDYTHTQARLSTKEPYCSYWLITGVHPHASVSAAWVMANRSAPCETDQTAKIWEILKT